VIVDPDFLDHWRTRMVFDALGEDELVPLYVLRIWAHCQSRKAMRFEMPSAGLKSLCRYKGDAVLLEKAMIDAGFIERDGSDICVPKWGEHNAKLIANWKNGATGGRPSKTDEEPSDNPNKTQTKPTETQAEPIEEDRTREDSNKPSSKKAEATQRASRLPADWVAPSEYIEFCKKERPDLHPIFMQDKFRDYWSGVSGKQGLKLNWFGTWRNFIRSERAQPQARGSPARPEKFDPVAHVNRNRNIRHERTIDIDESGEPI